MFLDFSTKCTYTILLGYVELWVENFLVAMLRLQAKIVALP